jgi:SOS-response transcriptional repressor LexA
MTPAQKNVYRVIKEWWDIYKFGPTYDDIRFCLMHESKSSVWKTVNRLVKKGYLKRTPGMSRSITVTKKNPDDGT